jgi:hypothetical protein
MVVFESIFYTFFQKILEKNIFWKKDDKEK